MISLTRKLKNSVEERLLLRGIEMGILVTRTICIMCERTVGNSLVRFAFLLSVYLVGGRLTMAWRGGCDDTGNLDISELWYKYEAEKKQARAAAPPPAAEAEPMQVE